MMGTHRCLFLTKLEVRRDVARVGERVVHGEEDLRVRPPGDGRFDHGRSGRDDARSELRFGLKREDLLERREELVPV